MGGANSMVRIIFIWASLEGSRASHGKHIGRIGGKQTASHH
jgi:hypothetical protein